MSTLKQIGNKLFKEDLASQKVELALMDDVKKEGLLFEKKAVELYEGLLEFSADKKKLQTEYNALLKLEQSYTTIRKEFDSKLKDLGLPKVNINELEDTEQIGKDVYGLYNTLIK